MGTLLTFAKGLNLATVPAECTHGIIQKKNFLQLHNMLRLLIILTSLYTLRAFEQVQEIKDNCFFGF